MARVLRGDGEVPAPLCHQICDSYSAAVKRDADVEDDGSCRCMGSLCPLIHCHPHMSFLTYCILQPQSIAAFRNNKTDNNGCADEKYSLVSAARGLALPAAAFTNQRAGVSNIFLLVLNAREEREER